MVESVAGFGLERRRSLGEHPPAMTLERFGQAGLARFAHRPNGREDPASRRVELLVGDAARAQVEFLRPVAGEARVRVAIDESGDRRAPATVQLFDVVVETTQFSHGADARHPTVLAENVSVIDDRQLSELDAG